MRLTGKVWKYGDNVDTDAIIPGRYLSVSTPDELACHCMEDIDSCFAGAVQAGDIIVAGCNFGCGSSREHAALAIQGAGIACVIAQSFARIFYRNAINSGLPILECPQVWEGTRAGEVLAVDLTKGLITNQSTGCVFQATPFPDFVVSIVRAGGLIPFTHQRLQRGEGRDPKWQL